MLETQPVASHFTDEMIAGGAPPPGRGGVGREHGHDHTAPAPRQRRVLISEDDEGFRSALAMSLRLEGYLVTETHDGRELLEALQNTPAGFFDLVIADHRMPRLSGLECLAQAGGRAPFVILSGAHDPTFRASAHKFGAAALVQKPVDLQALLSIVAALVAER